MVIKMAQNIKVLTSDKVEEIFRCFCRNLWAARRFWWRRFRALSHSSSVNYNEAGEGRISRTVVSMTT